MATGNFLGVFATLVPGANTGAAKPDRSASCYWFVWETTTGYQVQLLTAEFQPAEPPLDITANEFTANGFQRQPHILITPERQQAVTSPSERTLVYQWRSETEPKQPPPVVQEKAPALPALSSTEKQEALELDQDCRSKFALALIRWRRGEKRTSINTFQSFLRLKEKLLPAHKHMFTDFAITLRKCSLLTLACEHSKRVVELAPDDCNARFNLARAYYENNAPTKAFEELQKALELEPNFLYAIKFKNFLLKNNPQLRANDTATSAIDEFFPLDLQ